VWKHVHNRTLADVLLTAILPEERCMGSVYAASVCEMIAHFRVEIYQECAYGLRMLELSRRREYHVHTIVCDKSLRTQ
jgi:hypothetical protein